MMEDRLSIEQIAGSGNDVQAAKPRVLILTHSHPRLTSGGAEIAADALFQGLKKYSDAITWFLGCSFRPQTGRIGINLTQPFGEDNFLYQVSESFEHFKFANRDPNFPRMLTELLTELQPNIIHFHHYTNFGVEAFAIAKQILPGAKIVLTLHEYLAICHNYGQMVKAKTYRLCESESPLACQSCFPEVGARDFFLRKKYIQNFFENVDLFISPSSFLAERYSAWGIPRGKIVVLENVPASFRETSPLKNAQSQQLLKVMKAGIEDQRDETRLPSVWENSSNVSSLEPAEAQRRSSPLRLGFFGQMSPLKGIMVLLDAARRLAEIEISDILIEIHGDYSSQPPEFQEAVKEGLKDASKNVRYCGSYDNAHVHRLMQAVDAVIVPSIWWENSPVVIQEAYTNGKPVICSNIGGLAEKVRPGLDGFWFNVGDGNSLVSLLLDLNNQREALSKIANTMKRPVSAKDAIDAHVGIYRSLLGYLSEP